MVMKTREEVLERQKDMPVGFFKVGDGLASLQQLLDDEDAVILFDKLLPDARIEVTKARIAHIGERFRISVPGFGAIDKDEAIRCLESLAGDLEGQDEETKKKRDQVGQLLVRLEGKIIANVRNAVGAG